MGWDRPVDVQGLRRRVTRTFRPCIDPLERRKLLAAGGSAFGSVSGFAGARFESSVAQATPPDTSAAVGPNAMVEGVNSEIVVLNKQGQPLSQTSAADFFARVKPLSTIFDPRISYDAQAGRFVVVFVDLNGASHQGGLLVAVSPGSDPTVPASQWAMTRIDTGPRVWADFPALSTNADGIYITANMHGYDRTGQNEALNEEKGFAFVRVYAFNLNLDVVRTKDLARKQYQTLIPAVMHGAAPGGPMDFVTDTNNGHDLTVITMTGLLGNGPVHVTAHRVALRGVPAVGVVPPRQPGPNPVVDSKLSADVESVAWQAGQLIVTQDVGVEVNGVVTDQARWYLISTTGREPRVTDYGDIGLGVGVDTYHPSADINAAGDIGLTAMVSSSNPTAPQNPSMVVAVVPRSSIPAAPRFGQGPVFVPLDPSRQIVLVQPGATTLNPSGEPRAGDYSATVVDPSNPLVFWSANEYATGTPATENWGTWISRYTVAS